MLLYVQAVVTHFIGSKFQNYFLDRQYLWLILDILTESTLTGLISITGLISCAEDLPTQITEQQTVTLGR